MASTDQNRLKKKSGLLPKKKPTKSATSASKVAQDSLSTNSTQVSEKCFTPVENKSKFSIRQKLFGSGPSRKKNESPKSEGMSLNSRVKRKLFQRKHRVSPTTKRICIENEEPPLKDQMVLLGDVGDVQL